MHRVVASLLMSILCVVRVSVGYAATIELFDVEWNLDGMITTLGGSTAVDISHFDSSTGLGTVIVKVGGPGPHFVGMVVDHEIDQLGPGGFTNEFGDVQGTPASGRSWEIDSPGFPFGDIFLNLEAGQLDTTNSIPSTMPDDVAMALG